MSASLLVVRQAENPVTLSQAYAMDYSNDIDLSSHQDVSLVAHGDCLYGDRDSPSMIIEEAKGMLLRRVSCQDDDQVDTNGNISYPLANQSAEQLIASQLTLCVSKHGVSKAVPKRKAVSFNMELNQMHEYSCSHPLESDFSDTDSESGVHETELYSIGDANDLMAIGEVPEPTESTRARVAFADDVTYIQESKTEEKVSPRNSSISSDVLSSSVEESTRTKVELQEEIAELRNEYQEELAKLRKDYESRREDYMTELEEINDDIARKGRFVGRDVSSASDEEAFEAKLQQLKKDKEEVREFEEMLKERKEYCVEQQQQIDDYEKYLDRRHESLTDKEEDLKTLQDELQELSVALRRRERELRERSNRLDVSEERLKPGCNCEESVANVRLKTTILEEELDRTKEELSDAVKDKESLTTKVSFCEAENRRLHMKLKQLDSQLSLQLRINDKDRSNAASPISQLSRSSNGSVATLSSRYSERTSPIDEPAVDNPQRPLSRTCMIM